jgi:ribosomal protein S12 methylthiotransferase accessory factor
MIASAPSVIEDELVGIIRRVKPMPHAAGTPSSLSTFSAEVSEIGRYVSWLPDQVGSGTGFDSHAARMSAVGEAVERYCGNCVSRVDATSSARALASEGVPHIRPLEFRHFLPEQLGDSNLAFVEPSDTAVLEWCAGRRLHDDAELYVPASTVYLNYHRDPERRSFPRFHPVHLSGIAAGKSERQAITSALLEIIERDTTMLWWLGKRPATGLDVEPRSELQSLIFNGMDEKRFDLRWLLLPSDFRVPTVACVLVDKVLDTLTVGFAARFKARDAALKAAGEAFQLWHFSAGLLEPDSWLWKSVEIGWLGNTSIKPYREDRRYLDSFVNGRADMINLLHNSQLFLDKRLWSHALRRLHGAGRVGVGRLDASASVRDHADLVSEVERVGLEAIRVDVTTEDVRSADFVAVRVLVPGACPNAPTAYPPLGNERLQRAVGFVEGGNLEAHFDLSPMPHS